MVTSTERAAVDGGETMNPIEHLVGGTNDEMPDGVARSTLYG